MLVAIDGRSISHPQKGGFKTYIENLVLAMQPIAGENQFVIYYDRDYKFAPISENDRFTEVAVKTRAKYVGQVVREQISLPLMNRKSTKPRPGLWHFPYNTAPIVGMGDYILTLHDLTSYTHAAKIDWSDPRNALKELALFYYPRTMLRRSAKAAKLILTVSNYAKDSIVNELDVKSSKVIVTPLAASNIYRPISDEEKTLAGQRLASRFGINKPFVLTVASSLLKNPQGSINAFAQLPEELRNNYDLVIVMAYNRFRETVEKIAEQYRIQRNTKLLLDVGPNDLLDLYNMAELLLYPSFTDSFGLPVAEAMACGTAIICSNNTGLPELVGSAAIQFDPTDTSAISKSLALVLSDNQLAQELRERCLHRRNRFSWNRTAELTLGAYEMAYNS